MTKESPVNKDKFDAVLQKLIQSKPTSKEEISKKLRAAKKKSVRKTGKD
ncbi:MAG TPA: hypothetical protein VHX63_16295 [Acidobacteriaceae bacterium]|jgi:hypothetical protein|nr:hypothetical protein [Acidobacteriaceae bacterium]